jgi:uracil-DNA glycosylase family 4
MSPYGDFKKRILVIGEAPGRVEDRNGLPWQGQTGRLLQQTMHKLGIDLFKDCLSINSVNCRPPNNRTPSPFEIDCCRNVIVEKTISKYKPKIIILLGASAIQSFLKPRWPVNLGGILKWRGFRIPDQDYKCWVLPTFHPSYVYRIDSREANTIWEQDLSLAIDALNMKLPETREPKIHYIDDLKVLYEIKNKDEVFSGPVENLAIDYETTGLKSQMKGQRIVCVGITAGTNEVYAFMMPKTKYELKPLFDLLSDARIGKMAHNIKFEHNWTLNRYGVEIQNWMWDSMLAAHQIDNRSGITSLKFQTYVNFGVIIKEEYVAKYIYNSKNGFNQIYELLGELNGKEQLLRHVALDSYYEFLLAKKQMQELNYTYLPF